jgi:hypothetical protein
MSNTTKIVKKFIVCFVHPLTSTTWIPLHNSLLERAPSYFWGNSCFHYNLTWHVRNLLSPPFSFQVNPAPLLHGLNSLLETDERLETTEWRAVIQQYCSHACRPFFALRSFRRRMVPAPATRPASFDYPTDGLGFRHSTTQLVRLKKKITCMPSFISIFL